MNKNLGTSVGAVALAALLFRTTGSVSTPHEPTVANSAAAPQQSGKKSIGDGPWSASCEYWAPARSAAEPASEEQPAISRTLDEKQHKLTGNLRVASDEGESECGNDLQKRWGMPESNPRPEIQSLIALVPDPVRTNMALQFDRTIDALMAAAGDHGFVSSYYWLPWKEQSGGVKVSEEGGSVGHADAAKSEHEPGLIIFKYVPTYPTSYSPRASPAPDDFARVIYLFLVGETPTSGIDGFQIQKAFQYQDDLASAGTTFSKSRASDPNNLAIIGPTYTGSAASLRRAIETMLAKHPWTKSVSVNGATSSLLAVGQLNSTGIALSSAAPTTNDQASQKIEYQSFSYDGTFVQQRLLELLHKSSSPSPTRVALLIEDGTAFGFSVVCQAPPSQDSPSQASSSQASSSQASPCPVSSNQASPRTTGPHPEAPLVIRFPREISLLRNAQAEQGGAEAPSPTGSVPSPYLHLSLKDSNAYDSVPHLSREKTPLSQEAQLMTIARQLQRYRSQYIVIAGSNVLDLLFLAQFLHRACPDARLVFSAGDLLYEREIDNVPFIGTITFTPYPLIRTALSVIGGPRRAYSDSSSQAYYNAASYTIWDDPSKTSKDGAPKTPPLAGYRNILEPYAPERHPPLWVTAIGSDGYYPLGIASAQATDIKQILPHMKAQARSDKKHQSTPFLIPISPGRLWRFLCVVILLLCFSHIAVLCVADYWSPFTRELAVEENDQPRRRAMYIHIGTAMLCCMAFVLALPLFPTFRFCQFDLSATIWSVLTLAMGVVAVAVTFWKTRSYIGWKPITSPVMQADKAPQSNEAAQPDHAERLFLLHEQNVYFSFNLIAWITLVAVPLLWSYLCFRDHAGGLAPDTSDVGLFFSFRCVHPGNGVSPLVPVLLLLLSWYLWAVFQTWRLRFSNNSRPMLPGRLKLDTSYPLFVADDDLCKCDHARRVCLYKNITCLLITREILRRFLKALGRELEKRYVRAFDITLAVLYLTFFVLFVLFIPVKSLDAFFWVSKGFLPTPYEFLVTALFFPLLVIVLTGWIRIIFVWGALKRGLLDRLENLPIRFAFNRLKTERRMTMMRQGGLREQWRDMARSTESMRQMVNDPDLEACIRKGRCCGATLVPNPLRGLNAPLDALLSWIRWRGPAASPLKTIDSPLKTINDELDLHIDALVKHIGGDEPNCDLREAAKEQCDQKDIPDNGHGIDVFLMHAIEKRYAAFSEVLLEAVLVPYWKAKRSGLVASEDADADAHPKEASEEPRLNANADVPSYIRVAEEFLAIRYLSLIRAVLVNMRYLMMFVSVSFVLAIVAWNSYPFQPRQFIDWVFTGMLAVLGCGMIWVLAQMHRDPILSRIAHTKANELGTDFYLKIVSFGAVPVLTWLAYQFPGIGSTIFKFLQPATEVIK